jgi:hypothetical protein
MWIHENHYAMERARYTPMCPFCCPFGNSGLPKFLMGMSPGPMACTSHVPQQITWNNLSCFHDSHQTSWRWILQKICQVIITWVMALADSIPVCTFSREDVHNANFKQWIPICRSNPKKYLCVQVYNCTKLCCASENWWSLVTALPPKVIYQLNLQNQNCWLLWTQTTSHI